MRRIAIFLLLLCSLPLAAQTPKPVADVTLKMSGFSQPAHPEEPVADVALKMSHFSRPAQPERRAEGPKSKDA